MTEFVYVVLHYITYNDTFECVESIMKNSDMNITKIIVVDNGSPDNSYILLKERYCKLNFVHVISTGKNLGFANGNNYGITYARKHFDPDFIIAVNNDIVLIQNSNQKVIRDEYRKSEFSVLGPMIFTSDGKCNVNPGRDKPLTAAETDKLIASYKLQLLLQKMNLWSLCVHMKRFICGLFMHDSKKRRRRIKIFYQNNIMFNYTAATCVFQESISNILTAFIKKPF